MSLTSVTALCPWARLILPLNLVQEDQSGHNPRKYVDWDVKMQFKQTERVSERERETEPEREREHMVPVKLFHII